MGPRKRPGFVLSHGKLFFQVSSAAADPHALATTPGGCLDDDRITYLLSNLFGLGRVFQDDVASWDNGQTRLFHRLTGPFLSPISLIMSGGGPMKTKPEF